MKNSSAMFLPAMDNGLSPIKPIRFLVICAMFLVLAVCLPDSVFAPLNRATASLSGECLALFCKRAVVAGDIISLNGFRVQIVTECTALYSVLLFGAFLLAAPASLKARLGGLTAGCAIISSVNILRIAGITTIGAIDPVRFEIFHVYLGQVIMLLLVLGCCLAWMRWHAGARGGASFLFRAVCWATILFLPWLLVHKVYLARIDFLIRYAFFHLTGGYTISTPKPLMIYNHAFSVPIFLALLIASNGINPRRRIYGACAGFLVLSFWHALYRVTHIIWTAFNIDGIFPFHYTVYLLGQYLIPVFLWLLITVPPIGLLKGFGGKAARFMPLLLISLFISWPSVARGEAVVAIQPDGRGGFSLRADGLNDVAGGEIRLNYVTDGQSVPSVRVVGGLGARAGMRALTDSPGTIVFSFASHKPVDGGGLLATLTLSGRDGGAGQILSISATLRDSQGVEKSAATQIENYPDNYEKPAAPAASDPRPHEQEKAGPVPPEPGATSDGASSRETATPALSYATPLSRSGSVPFRRLESVLDRFRGYAGDMTREAIDRLFAPITPGGFRQEPAVILADGLTEARLTFMPADGGEIICFIITGGRFTALRKGETAGEWILYLAPERGALTTSVAVQTAQGTVEYPLTLAPPMSLFHPSPDMEDLPRIREYVRIANERAKPCNFAETGTDGGKP